LIQDLDQEITDALYEWQDNNYEILNLELNLTVEINEVNLEKINYYLDNIKDDIYRVSEGYSYLSESSDKYNSSLEAQSDYYNDLYEARKNNEISQE
jgi:hypothetical protein